MEAIEFDLQDVDFFENIYNDYNIYGHSDSLDYYLECYVDDDGIHINSGHSIDEDSETSNDLPFDELKVLLNNQITVNKYNYAY